MSAALRARIVAAMEADATCADNWPLAKTARQLLPLVLAELDRLTSERDALRKTLDETVRALKTVLSATSGGKEE